MENLEELKTIVGNAPFENIGEDIFINALGNYVLFYEDDYFVRDGDKWVKCCGYLPCYGLRSLSDIERIIELMETNREAKKFALLSLKEAIEPDGLINSEAGLKTIKTIQNAIDNIVKRL